MAATQLHPRAYVVGRAAAQCLVVSEPWVDCAPQIHADKRAHPLRTVYRFDRDLAAGDWCTTAYVITPTSGEIVAIPVVA